MDSKESEAIGRLKEEFLLGSNVAWAKKCWLAGGLPESQSQQGE